MTNIVEVDVVIVGAGLAGLTAALELNKTNVSFMVLEARNRAGGRINGCITENDVPIDLGAQWISPKHYRVKKLLSQFELQTISTYRKGKNVYSFNDKVSYRKFPPLSSFALIDIYQFSIKLNKLSRKLVTKNPWKGAVATFYDQITVGQLLHENMYTKEGKKYLTMLIEEMLCTNLHEVSALDVLWSIKAAGSIQNIRNSEEFGIQKGAAQLVERITEVLKGKISFDSPVEKMSYEDNTAFLFSKGKCWKAKKVIVAIPPNLQSRILFQPPLPAIKAQLNERSGLPSVIKMIFVYEKPFWREIGLNGIAYLEHKLMKLTFDSSPKDESAGVLTVLINGKKARQLEKLCQAARKKEVQSVLVQILGEEGGKPLQIYEKNWSEEEWTRGGYGVHFAPGVITNYGYALVEPIASLHWAGSETATEWRLFMEGAVQSGERAAKEVVERLRQ